MNTCNNLPLYHYNEMSKEERQQFEKHLKECGACCENLKAFAAVKDVSRLQSAPLDVLNNIFDQTTRKQSFFSFFGTWKVSIAMAACLMIAVFSVVTHKPSYDKAYYYSDVLSVSYEDIYAIDSELDELEKMLYI
ncbi:MAG: zf-HC2 domain-containing protein [Endomicrobia bacterium]|nr:zf-HC2 domain-containing protein [Endomicrobiia bacterium]MCL2506661.1 zf-HC2 domain-containing protein [Endomicrobiia bacterium]